MSTDRDGVCANNESIRGASGRRAYDALMDEVRDV